jgi:hypothetical protein
VAEVVKGAVVLVLFAVEWFTLYPPGVTFGLLTAVMHLARFTKLNSRPKWKRLVASVRELGL